MSENPWQSIKSTSVLFIVDAEHRIEERLLMQWLSATKNEVPFNGDVSHCVVPIAHQPEDIQTDGLELALEVSPDTLIAPVRIVWKTKLDTLKDKPRFRDILGGNPRRPSARRAKRILKKDSNAVQYIMGVPATLGDLNARYSKRKVHSTMNDSLADYVAEQASLALEVAERRLRGSRYKVPRQVSKQVRGSERYRRGIEEIAQKTGESEAVLRQRALPYFKELVAIPHVFWQDVWAALNRWFMSLGYKNQVVVDAESLQNYRAIVREHPTALLWTHKTHMDGPTMQMVLFEQDFPPPHIMGGINMAFAGVGFLARRSGAIFIRRSFQDNPLYKLVLREYLAYLLEKRFPLTWSFEGTRSRVGKLMPPRYGMLKYTMDAMQESNADSLYIIPVAINYDLINDVKDYAAEQAGAKKRPESLSWLISYIRRMRQPLGRIYVDFGKPVVVEKEGYGDDPLALQKTAFKVGVEVNRVTPITLTGLMCMSLLGAAPRAQTIEEMMAHMDELKAWAEHRNIRFTSDFDEGRTRQTLRLIKHVVDSGLINRYDQGPETVYAMDADQHMMASYYRNTIVHHFVTKAITELALVASSEVSENALETFWNEADRLKDLFKFEFFYEPTDEFHAEVKKELSYVEPQWQELMQKQDYALELLPRMTPLVSAGVLRPYIEAYRVVADVYARLGANETLDEKACIDASMKYAQQAYLQHRINSKASIGQILFSNGFKLFDSYNLVSVDAPDLLERRKTMQKQLHVLSARLEKIRVLAMPSEAN